MQLILGGAKSGKTSFAETMASDYVQESAGSVYYLASARAWDDEMKVRIQRHQQSRPSDWITLEESLNVPEILTDTEFQKGDIILFDCLTLWLTNILMDLGDDFPKKIAEQTVSNRISDFLKAVSLLPCDIIVVSNLVEQGLVSPHFLGRVFQECCGLSHQELASESERVYHVIAGLAQRLK